MVAVATLGFADVEEGLEASLGVLVTASAVDRFVDLSGDICPLHTSDEFAAGRGFPGRVVHGAYLASLVSRLVGTQLPGSNGILQQVQLHFQKPTYIGDRITVVGRVERKLEPLRAMVLSLAIDGEGPLGGRRRVASGKVHVGFTG